VPVSYGFRPGKSAHDAETVARTVIGQGYRWVVEVDLDAFFDRVNHDGRMARVARKVKDKGLLKLIRRYLEAESWLMGCGNRRRREPRRVILVAVAVKHHAGRL
jgi:retron-type reverse transcriptase